MSRQPERSALAKLQASEFKGFVIRILKSHLENTSVFQVHCQTASRVSCNLRVKRNTCYCCDLYNCGKYVCERVPFGYIPPRITYANKQSEKKTTTNMLSLFYLGSGLYMLVCCVLLSLKFSSVRKNVCVYLCFREHPLMGLQNKDVLKKFRKSSMIWK